jgi:curli biogenesis system outer membrane secretion channel CsgG
MRSWAHPASSRVVRGALSAAASRGVAALLRARRSLAATAATAAGLLVAAAAAAAPSADLVEEFRRDPALFFLAARGEEAAACGEAIAADAGAPAAERIRALAVAGAVHQAAGRHDAARSAFERALAIDPSADLVDAERLPAPVVRRFYALRDRALLARSGRDEAPPGLDVRTVAVGDIDNNAIVAGSFDLDRFARGLAQIIAHDLSTATPLRVVERQRLAVLREEIGLGRDASLVDPEHRVAFGRLTGAQSFLFGSVLSVAKDVVRLDLRWVNTATGEVLLAEGIEAKIRSGKDLLALERKVLVEHLVPQIQAMLAGEMDARAVKEIESRAKQAVGRRKATLADGTSRVDQILRVGDALLAEERGEMERARAIWEQVAASDPGDAYASERERALAAYAALGGGGAGGER